MRFYKVHNSVYNYKLSSSAFFLYNYLVNRFYWTDTVRIKLSTIADKTGMSVNTVRRAINELISCSLMERRHRYRRRLRTTNEYTVRRLSGNYARVEEAVFRNKELDKSMVYVYCAVKSFESNRGHRAFPSYGQLCELTGLSRATVISKVAGLSALAMYIKSVYLKTAGDFGHNNYCGITMSGRVIFLLVLARSGCICITAHKYTRSDRRAFFSFFRKIGSIKIDKHISDVPKYVKKLKRKFFIDYKYNVEIYAELDICFLLHRK